MKMLLLGCLRGNPILYYGEELGLRQVDVPFALLQDPEVIANWPLTLSRDEAALKLGGFEVTHADEFARTHQGDRIICAFNLSAAPQVWTGAVDLSPLLSIGVTGADFAAYGALVAN